MSRLKLLAVVFALGAAGCRSTTTTTPTPTPTPITDTFLGTLTVNGGVTHQFATGRSGAVQETLTALSPDSAVVLGISLGTWNGNSCQVVLAKDNATLGSIVLGSASSAGTLCARVYDVGNLTAPASYELTIVHN
jgi:hypothetical protein